MLLEIIIKRGMIMSKYRETVCKFYICKGECEYGKIAEHKGICQHCQKYEPRARVKTKNKKKDYNDKQRSCVYDY